MTINKYFQNGQVIDEHDHHDKDEPIVANIWSERWLQNYAAALIQRQWGQNLSKFQDLQLLGGVKINGPEIASIADEEIKVLEKELQDTYEISPFFIMA